MVIRNQQVTGSNPVVGSIWKVLKKRVSLLILALIFGRYFSTAPPVLRHFSNMRGFARQIAASPGVFSRLDLDDIIILRDMAGGYLDQIDQQIITTGGQR